MAADDPSALGTAAGLAAGTGMAALLADDDQTAETPAPGPPELKLGFDEAPGSEKDDEDDLITDEINLDELDLLLEDDPLPSGPEPDDDFKTEELNLADLEKMLDSDEGDAPAPAPPAADDMNVFQEETDESIIEELDLDMDDLESLLDDDRDLGGGVETPPAAEAAGDEIKLDLAPGLEDLLADDDQDLGIEETAEVGVSEVVDTDAGMVDEAPSEAALGDDDIDLELAPGIDSLFDEVEDQDVPLEETEELDFSALGDDLDQLEKGPGEDTPDTDALELDLDLGSDSGADAQPPAVDEDLAMALSLEDGGERPSEDDAEELDLGDLESVLEGDAAGLAKLSPGEEQPELVLELEGDTDEPDGVDDMDLVLEDLDLGAPDASEPGEVDETRELDLDELESLLDDAEAVPPADAPPAEDEGLILDLDLDGEPAVDGEEPDDATRELNLDDIEKILESQDSAAPASLAADAEEDLALDLDLGDDAEAAEADLLGDGETTAGSDALDLSELEKMLDVEDTTDSPSLSGDGAVEDLDLDFELPPATDEGDELDLEFDMLEDEGEESSALFDTSESEDLGLDLDVGATPAPEEVALEEDLEFEIMGEEKGGELELDILDDDSEDLDLDILDDGSDDLDLDILDEGAKDLDLEIIDEDAAPVEAAALGAAAGAAASRDLTQELMDEMAAADTQTMDIPPAETKPIKPAPVPTKKKSSKMLVLLLLLVLLGAGGYFVYDKTGFDFSKFKLSDLPEIPFVSEWLGAKKAPEAVVPVEATLKGSWVENKSDGRIYIIQGRVKNEYTEPRSFIRVTGQIFADGRKFKRAAQAYCGNMPSREDLENLPVADLQKLLGNRSGADNVNVKVAPGKEVPFTVIFAGLPEDVELQEYAVEISGSLPATKAKSN
jgi:hypothetical protein